MRTYRTLQGLEGTNVSVWINVLLNFVGAGRASDANQLMKVQM